MCRPYKPSECYVIPEGQGCIEAGNELPETVEPGVVVLIPPGNPAVHHQYRKHLKSLTALNGECLMSDFDQKAATWDADPIKQERALAVAGALRQQVPLLPTWRALEYGCGTGLLSFALGTDLGNITLADASPGMLAVLETKIADTGLTHLHPLLLDLTNSPLPTERYDLIHTLMTLHHVANTGQLLQDFHTLLRPGGWLAIADLDREDGSFHGPGFTGHCGFDREALGAQMAAAGFRDVAFSTCYVMRKTTNQGIREYPLFLAVATRSDSLPQAG